MCSNERDAPRCHEDSVVGEFLHVVVVTLITYKRCDDKVPDNARRRQVADVDVDGACVRACVRVDSGKRKSEIKIEVSFIAAIRKKNRGCLRA